jgi:adenylylsulfate kinase-like enzyme
MPVTVTISGPVGCGKTAVYVEVFIALKSMGLEIVHEDEDGFNSEINSGMGDSHDILTTFKPLIIMVEKVDAT